MCASCGCGTSDLHTHDEHQHDHDHPHAHHHDRSLRMVALEARVLARNDEIAGVNRRWLAARGLTALNLLSSPGAGKTTLLERTLVDLQGRLVFSVIEGDQETDEDARRIRRTGCRAVQINTGTGCHLEAGMIGRALADLAPPSGSVVFIENVGNLVCPALFDLGERSKVVLASVTEGEDKPLKYPHMFRAADLILLNKVDLQPHLHFDPSRFFQNARLVNARAPILSISATAGDGLDQWYRWLEAGSGHGIL